MCLPVHVRVRINKYRIFFLLIIIFIVVLILPLLYMQGA